MIGCTSFPGCSVLGFGPNLNPRKKDFTLWTWLLISKASLAPNPKPSIIQLLFNIGKMPLIFVVYCSHNQISLWLTVRRLSLSVPKYVCLHHCALTPLPLDDPAALGSRHFWPALVTSTDGSCMFHISCLMIWVPCSILKFPFPWLCNTGSLSRGQGRGVQGNCFEKRAA